MIGKYVSGSTCKIARYCRTINSNFCLSTHNIKICSSSFTTDARIDRNKVDQLATGVLSGDRSCLAKSITLVESTKTEHRLEADYLLDYLLSRKDDWRKSAVTENNQKGVKSAKTLRIGVAGPPGAGKSTFIEQLGLRFISRQHRVAVIPVDPSSPVSGGSILGDKTRMELLSREKDAYIRASPTRGILGGVAEHTSDVINLCEAAGYDIVIVESVGLGQSEVEIDSAVDMLLLLVPPGGGDSLQATKKGIMEAVDLVIVNKADGNLLSSAKHTKADYGGAMQFIRQKHHCWQAEVIMLSARTNFNIEEALKQIDNYKSSMDDHGLILQRRTDQSLHWMQQQLYKRVIFELETSKHMKNKMSEVNHKIRRGFLTPSAAANILFQEFRETMKKK